MRLLVASALLAVSLVLAGPLTGLSQASADECVAPEAISLPLSNLPSSRVKFNRYKSEVKAYQACAGEAADLAVQAHYERALDQFIVLIRIWAIRR
jgi:hypothetical protein